MLPKLEIHTKIVAGLFFCQKIVAENVVGKLADVAEMLPNCSRIFPQTVDFRNFRPKFGNIPATSANLLVTFSATFFWQKSSPATIFLLFFNFGNIFVPATATFFSPATFGNIFRASLAIISAATAAEFAQFSLRGQQALPALWDCIPLYSLHALFVCGRLQQFCVNASTPERSCSCDRPSGFQNWAIAPYGAKTLGTMLPASATTWPLNKESFTLEHPQNCESNEDMKT